MTYKSLASAMSALNAQENARAVAQAQNLRRAASLPKPKVGPRIAR